MTGSMKTDKKREVRFAKANALCNASRLLGSWGLLGKPTTRPPDDKSLEMQSRKYGKAKSVSVLDSSTCTPACVIAFELFSTDPPKHQIYDRIFPSNVVRSSQARRENLERCCQRQDRQIGALRDAASSNIHEVHS